MKDERIIRESSMILSAMPTKAIYALLEIGDKALQEAVELKKILDCIEAEVAPFIAEAMARPSEAVCLASNILEIIKRRGV